MRKHYVWDDGGLPYLYVDFDGVLNTYTGDYANKTPPPLREGAREFLMFLHQDFRVVIFTARRPLMAVEHWVVNNGLSNYVTAVTNVKGPAHAYIDDAAITFRGDYQAVLDALESFRPWWEPEDAVPPHEHEVKSIFSVSPEETEMHFRYPYVDPLAKNAQESFKDWDVYNRATYEDGYAADPQPHIVALREKVTPMRHPASERFHALLHILKNDYLNANFLEHLFLPSAFVAQPWTRAMVEVERCLSNLQNYLRDDDYSPVGELYQAAAYCLAAAVLYEFSDNIHNNPSLTYRLLHETVSGLGELHDKKQADYGRDNDPFANVAASEEWGIEPWIGAMMRATDKVRRLGTFAQKGVLQNESAADSLRDFPVYCLIAIVLYERTQVFAKGY